MIGKAKKCREEKRKKEGKKVAETYCKCEMCGKAFTKKHGDNRMACPDCRALMKKEHDYFFGKGSAAAPRRKYKNNIDLKIIAAQAKAMGKTYGEIAPQVDSGELRLWTINEYKVWCAKIKEEEKERRHELSGNA